MFVATKGRSVSEPSSRVEAHSGEQRCEMREVISKQTYLGFWDPKEDHHESNHVQTCEESKCTCWCECFENLGEGQAQHSCPEKAGRNGPTHAHLSMRQREHLGRVRERNRSFTRRVERGIQVDEQSNNAQVCRALFGDVKGKPSRKKCPCHVGKGKKEERSAAKSVDGDECGNSEDEVDGAETEGAQERDEVRGTTFTENSRRVECHDLRNLSAW
jgi:hypothetical protein